MARGDGVDARPRELLVSGHVNVDRFLTVPEFPPPDRTVPVDAHRVELGGTATNIALVASRYGVATGLVARIGASFPPEFWSRLRRARIDLRGVERVPTPATPTAYILEDRRGGQRTLMEQGPMAAPPRRARPRSWLAEYSWLHLTTGDADFQLRLLADGLAHGVHATADPAQELYYRWDRGRLRRLLAGSEILFGNHAELAYVARLLHARGPADLVERVPLVVRTEGEDGATAWSRAGSVHAAGRRPRRLRTVVGAGDAFRGGFYAAWFEGEELLGCLAAGNRAAARWLEGAR